MARISGFGNPFYRTTYMNGRIFRSTGQSYSSTLLSNLSTQNPRLAKKVFSKMIDTQNNSKVDTVKDALSNYVNDNSDVKKFLAAQATQTPLYTGKSSIQADYYSTLGNLFNYLL